MAQRVTALLSPIHPLDLRGQLADLAEDLLQRDLGTLLGGCQRGDLVEQPGGERGGDHAEQGDPRKQKSDADESPLAGSRVAVAVPDYVIRPISVHSTRRTCASLLVALDAPRRPGRP